MNRKYWIWFFLVAGLLVAYGLFNPEQYLFPKCPFRSLTGWLCPGCGSQRAIHQLLHGRVAASVSYNPLFLPVILYALLGGFVMVALPGRWPAVRQSWYGLIAARVWLLVIVVFWLLRNLL